MQKPYYPNLAAELLRRGMDDNDISEILNISERAAIEKLSGEAQFTVEEAKTLMHAMNRVKLLYSFAYHIEFLFAHEE